MTRIIISSFMPHEIGKTPHGELTTDNEGRMQKTAFLVIREATLEEYRTQVEEMGFEFYSHLRHGPYYYEVQILD